MKALVIGGGGSGKSEFAENLTASLGHTKTYIATMRPYGAEARGRIERHRRARAGKGFKTVERYADIKSLDLNGTVLLECMSNLLANEMFRTGGTGENAYAEITNGIDTLAKKCDNLIIVTNEIFSDGIEYDADTSAYMRVLGRINRYAAARFDSVYEVVCGRAVKIK